MAEKPNKGMVIGIAVAVVAVIAIIVGVIIAKGNEGGVGEGGDGTEAGQVEGVNNMDFSDINVTVEYGDYDGMYTLSKSIQNGEMLGQIVKIEGDVSHPMSKYSIVEEDENGSKIGTEFVIEGLDESEYPSDGARIVITGEVIEKEPLYYVIRTVPEYVEVIEESDDMEGEEYIEEEYFEDDYSEDGE